MYRLLVLVVLSALVTAALAVPHGWNREWPRTDFTRAAVPFDEIVSGGPGRDGIPALSDPRFEPLAKVADVGGKEPAILVSRSGITKAYPLRVLMWHEIVNDEIAGLPVAVTYCPLCNAGVVFNRRIDSTGGPMTLTFGVTGKLRHSDMIMYDRNTESWWQQFTGRAIVGELLGHELEKLPATTVPMQRVREDHPDALVLVPSRPGARRYGTNPYVRYDGSRWPFLYKGEYDGPVPALAYVVAVGKQAWPLQDVRREGEIRSGDLLIRWQPGMASALDAKRIEKGRDIGYVEVLRGEVGAAEPVPHDVTFAFAFKAFHPDGCFHGTREACAAAD